MEIPFFRRRFGFNKGYDNEDHGFSDHVLYGESLLSKGIPESDGMCCCGKGLALCVMLAMALGRIKENQADKMRSLVASA